MKVYHWLVELALNKPINRFVNDDIALALPAFAFVWPIALLAELGGQGHLFRAIAKHKWYNRSLFLVEVLFGRYSWVGSTLPIREVVQRM